jgi:hypothetical protein
MPDVSMARLREMGQTCDDCTSALCTYFDGESTCMPNSAEAEAMATELLRLRELIGHPCNFRVDLKPERVILEMPLDEFHRCRALLTEAPK